MPQSNAATSGWGETWTAFLRDVVAQIPTQPLRGHFRISLLSSSLDPFWNRLLGKRREPSSSYTQAQPKFGLQYLYFVNGLISKSISLTASIINHSVSSHAQHEPIKTSTWEPDRSGSCTSGGQASRVLRQLLSCQSQVRKRPTFLSTLLDKWK